jgi:transcriptional regulator with XRE-family HTH domain
LEKINVQVAQKLKELRKSLGLSLDEVATRSGVSRAMLSQIETLKTNPTIAVLWKIANGLQVSFADLLQLEAAPDVRLSRAKQARYLFSEDGAFKSRPLLSNVPGHQVELYELHLQPESQQEADAHPAGTYEQLIVQSGKIELELESATYSLGPADALFFPADRPHRYCCVGRRSFIGLSLILYRS